MQHNQFALLRDRRFLPLFITQFLGAFHDNLFKNALVVMLLYTMVITSSFDPKILVSLATAVFIIPFMLFSAIGGQLSDKYPKQQVIRSIKAAEIALACLGTMALLMGSLYLSFLTLFALGTQSAFFGPSKYAIVPQHLGQDELIGGNALLNTGTFLAILIGTIAGTVLTPLNAGVMIVCAMLIICALCGYMASRFIPEAAAKDPDLVLDFNPLRDSINITREAFAQDKIIVRSIVGVAWFYFLGALFMAQLPNFTQQVLGADERVLAFLFVIFSVGIACGGLLNDRILRGRIEARFVPYAVGGITLFAVDLFLATASREWSAGQGLVDFKAFIAAPANWRILFDMAMIAICGGLFVVPLNTMIQHHAPADHRARILAGGAVTNALFIVASSVLAAALIAVGLDIPEIFALFAALNLVAVFYLSKIPRTAPS